MGGGVVSPPELTETGLITPQGYQQISSKLCLKPNFHSLKGGRRLTSKLSAENSLNVPVWYHAAFLTIQETISFSLAN